MKAKSRCLSVLITALVLTLLASHSVSAATYYWDTDGTTAGFGMASGAWGTDAFWSTDPTGSSATASPATGTGDSINFGAGTTGLGAGTIPLGNYSTRSAGSITFASGSGAIILGNAGVGSQLTLANGGTITVNNASDTIGAGINGATTVIKAGTGTLILSGRPNYANSFTAITIANGTLQIGVNNTMPTTVAVSFGAASTSGILDLGGFSQQVAGLALGAGHAAWTTSDIIGNSSTTADGTLTFAGTSTFGGVIQDVIGSGTRKTLVTVQGGTLTLSSVNTYAGATTINPSARLKIDVGAGGALGSTPVTINNAGTLNYDNTTSSGAQSVTMNGSVAAAGEGTLQLTRTALQTFSLTLGSLAALPGGGVLNFVYGGTPGTIGTDSKIAVSGQAVGFINSGTFFGGSSYAAYDAGGFVRALNYNTDANAEIITVSQAAFTAGKLYEQITGSGQITAQGSQTITTLNLDNANNLTLAGGATLGVNGILKTGNAAGGTISGGTGLQPASGAGLVIRTDQAGDTLTISTPILANGVNALTKSGAGTLTLSGASTYTGQTYVDNGTLSISANNNLGAVATGAQLNMNGGVLKATGSFALDNAGSNKRAIVLVNSNAIAVASGNTLTNNGVISGSGSFTKSDTGTLTLGGVNTFTGGTFINGGIVQFTGSGQLSNSGSQPCIYVNNATLVITNTAQLGGWNNLGGNPNIIFNGSTLQTSGSFDLSSSHFSIGLGSSGGTFNVPDGTIAYQANNSYTHNIQGAGSLTKTGAGTLVLSNNAIDNTYAGGTYINSGTLQVGAQAGTGGRALPNGGAVTVGGGTLDLTTNATVGAVTLTSGSITGTNAAVLTGSSYSMQSGTVSAILGGGATVALTKTGVGTLTLSASNTYSGATTINGGTLALGAAGAIDSTPSINIAAGATYDVSAIAAYALSSNNTLSASGTGTTTGTTAAAISGGTTIDLGSRPIALTFTPTSFTGDSTHPALYISTGTLSLSNNTFTVTNASGAPLNNGTYTLIQQAAGGIGGSVSGSTIPVAGAGMGAGGTASLALSGGALNLTVSGVPQYSFYWANGVSGNWSDAANWLDNLGASAAPAAGGQTNIWLSFNQPGTYDANNNLGTLLLNRLNFGGATVTLSGNDLVLTNNGATGPMISQNGLVAITVSNNLALNNTVTLGGGGAGAVTFAGVISGAGGLTKTNSGSLMLTGANTNAGVTAINGGAVVLGNAAALGTTAGNTTIGNGATLDLNGLTIAEPFGTIVGAGVGGNGALVNNSGTPAGITGDINAGSSAFTVAGSGDMLLARANGSSAAFVITKNGTGTLTLGGTADNAFLRLTLSTNGGTVVLAKASSTTVHALGGTTSVGSNSILQLGGTGDYQLFNGVVVTVSSGGVFDLNGRNQNYSGGTGLLNLSGTGISGGGALVNSQATTTATMTLGSGGLVLQADSSIGGAGNITLAGGVVSGVGKALAKVGVGTLTLSGANTYSGNTTVNNGTLKLASTGSLSNSPVINVVSGAVFDVSAVAGYTVYANQTLTGFGGVTGDVTVASGAVFNYNYNASAANVLQISGTLTLPTTLTLNITGTPPLPSSVNLFSAGTITPVDVSGWTVNCADKKPVTVVVVSGKQVRLVTSTGSILSVY